MITIFDLIDLSIHKWQAITYYGGVDFSANNCALCLEFHAPQDCSGCPVKYETGKDFCADTPYFDWLMSSHEVAPQRVITEKNRKAANDMLLFMHRVRRRMLHRAISDHGFKTKLFNTQGYYRLKKELRWE